MCGISLPSLPRGVSFRRVASSQALHEAADGAETELPLKPSKSATSLLAVLDSAVVAELASLRTTLDPHRLSASASAQSSSGDDTARGSPTSSYEQLLRSRSPSAVLFSGEEAAAARDAALCAAAASRGLPQPQGEQAAFASQAAAEAWDAGLLAGDHPFLESAASFSVVEVAAAGGGPAMPPAAAPLRDPLPGSASPPPGLDAAAAAAAAAAESNAAVAASDDPICAVAAKQCAAAAAAAAEDAAAASPRSDDCPAYSAPSLSVAAAAAASPFAGMAQQQLPSLISHSPPHPHQALRRGDGGSVAGSEGSSSSPSAGSGHHSRSGSLAAEMRELSLSRRGSIDCTVGHSSHLCEGHAAEELFYRLNHARQTVDFVKRQAHAFGMLNKAALGVWDALELLNTLREYESALLGDPDATPDMPLLEHALQCAEACRDAFPDEDYMHLAGLLAPLGKLLAHAKFGAEPQFAICGETFPVGCRFHPAVAYSQYFCANPDRRKRLYNSPTGVYRQGCGLGGVLMSWGAGEYLHLVLRLNGATLPPEALFCIRHQKLRCVFRQNAPYAELLSEFDRVQLPRLAKFQEVCQYRRMPRAQPLLVPIPGGGAAGEGGAPVMRVAPELKQYYDGLLAKYLPEDVLLW